MFKNKDSYQKFQLTSILYSQVVHGLALRKIGFTDFWKCVDAFSCFSLQAIILVQELLDVTYVYFHILKREVLSYIRF